MLDVSLFYGFKIVNTTLIKPEVFQLLDERACVNGTLSNICLLNYYSDSWVYTSYVKQSTYVNLMTYLHQPDKGRVFASGTSPPESSTNVSGSQQEKIRETTKCYFWQLPFLSPHEGNEVASAKLEALTEPSLFPCLKISSLLFIISQRAD